MTRMDIGSEDTSGLGNGALPVSEFVRQARRALERAFPLMWISGEIANLTRAASGHFYFTLRDEVAQVRCVMYRSRAQLLPFRLMEGQRVEARALTTLYEARGEFQLQVENLRLGGQGSLFEAFVRLKARLEAAGLFDAARKRPLPAHPRGVGIVSSLQAAALRDVLAALARRAPHLPVVLYPSPVQGEDAGARLARAVATASARATDDGIDVLILCRGGGSLEDLWAFNDEALVRAIVASTIPVVSGVGHETDFTLSDFAADLRAATPTAAAEWVSAGSVRARETVAGLRAAVSRLAGQALERRLERLDRVRSRLIHPRDRLAAQGVQCQALVRRLALAASHRLARAQGRFTLARTRLNAARPDVAGPRAALVRAQAQVHAALGRSLAQRGQHLQTLRDTLQNLDPQAVLARGYSIVRTADGQILRSATDAPADTRLEIQPGSGHLVVRVEQSVPSSGKE